MSVKLCKDCRWARYLGEGAFTGHSYQCGHAAATRPPPVELVTGRQGRPAQTSCYMMRAFEYGPDGAPWCGQEGRFWEPVEIGFGPVQSS